MLNSLLLRSLVGLSAGNGYKALASIFHRLDEDNRIVQKEFAEILPSIQRDARNTVNSVQWLFARLKII